MQDDIASILTKSTIPSESDALAGRDQAVLTSAIHAVKGGEITRDIAENEAEIILGLGCFWGAERKFWNTSGVTLTAVGYSGGHTKNPTYEEVCTGQTGHTEVVRVVYDTRITNLESILKVFWENHNPTEGMRQGNDIGSQYRSSIYVCSDEDKNIAQASLDVYQKGLIASGLGMITTEIETKSALYYAEEYHQQYLHKKPNGYCGLKGTGVVCAI
ncbi:peptide-methionine (S)-S-oxide reductase MsrA [Marinomonas dokdonensis]|uniref:peptide-methionine (S)-S-oxide reductase MsrA n=1 Tax=Marinomonas dokdonensis TaxID=328224 RepID=UPI0040554900